MSHAYALFSASQTSDVFLWNVMIRGFTENGLYDRSILLYRQMLETGVAPDNFTFPFVLKACGHLRDVQFGEEVHRDVMEFGYESDIFMGNSLITMYGKCGRFEISRKVFDGMPHKNVVSWSSMIGAYANNGRHYEGLSLFYRMLDERIKPNRITILNAVQCVHRENEANAVCRTIVDNGLDLDQSVQSAAVGMYARCGRIDVARRFFDGILDKDLVSWSSMVEAYVQANLPAEALELFRQMILWKNRPDFVTLLSVVRAFANLSSLHQARFIHGFIIRASLNYNILIETAIIDLYAKCGSLNYARKVFDRMQERNLVSWSTMISGYGMHGYGREALDLFNQMKDSAKPDHITFVSVLSACSHAGLIAEGWRCFNSMAKDFGVTPRSEHYACMVDLLGRAGQLSEAQEFIESMPIKPDSGVWGALLGACRIHLNVELAELAAKSLFELDSENPGRYVLLYNIYISSGKREEANQIRTLMKRRGVRKTTGHTVVELKNKVYKFVAGDKSNPQTDVIYAELERLMERIRQEGYVPDTNFVLHDVEEETKEKMLSVHSEKLAIAFGLLNSTPGSMIRIKKNLRVCGDCHTATKFISKVTEREFLVRDAHRFHHFKSGVCSCGDYW
ncbi:PREDICTED: pentatricopeptide repeat-containing protein At1g11290, chloroplastic [Nelumbo nucifera]|nr:PREDICTED: pentatricopeptide repeat-containing protein At1g11290, chloroplastic [Nelumbo nucifera]